ncbi:unnamed protein product [Callosobruchus maculatus]|uniref:C2H2-type domain-containing protein n=1 Tax=Callosobruchus maculatus TaxID=64391 RepID=A0A653BUW1_CALMS|nr:unnamed protein product [Callosobruchus maculatus]
MTQNFFSPKGRLKRKRKPNSFKRTQRLELIVLPPKLDEPLRCRLCEENYHNNLDFAFHSKMHNEDNAYSCHLCDYRNPSKSLLETHVVCDICGKRIATKDKLKYHVRIHTGDKPFSCKFCKKGFVKKQEMEIHERVHTGEKPFACQFCGKKFAQLAPFKYHIKTHTGEKHHFCRICNKGFISFSNLKIHLKSCVPTRFSEPVQYKKRRFNTTFDEAQEIDEEKTRLTNLLKDELLKCKDCTLKFNTHVDFAIHSKTHNDAFVCHLCTYNANSRVRITKHVLGHRRYRCEVCRKILKKQSVALKHSDKHVNSAFFQCEICGRKLASAKSLDMHMNTIHHEIVTGMPLSKYDCPLCKKHYESETGLRRHYSSQHKEMGVDLSVVCEMCGKRISNRTRLVRHLRTHTGQKPFSCDVCGRSFASKCLVTSHMRVHTGEKPYVCVYCGKRFGQSAPYRYHVKIHTGEKKRYRCEVCRKILKKQSVALKHSDKHVNSAFFQCEICGRKLASAKSLDMHMNTIHHEIVTGMPLSKYDCPLCKKHYESETGLRRH